MENYFSRQRHWENGGNAHTIFFILIQIHIEITYQPDKNISYGTKWNICPSQQRIPIPKLKNVGVSQKIFAFNHVIYV